MSQTVNGVTTNYVLDSASPLTQVLQDGTNTYVYGVDRIAQMNGTDPQYFLTDGLGSVRQLVDSNGAVILAKSYDPYGTETGFVGSGLSSYGFTGEMTDSTGLTYLRARYYESGIGRFLTRDTWKGDANQPMSYNPWNYVQSNPINYVDPSGHERGVCVLNPPSANAEYVENNVHLAKYNWLNTYTAAGIAVQCWRDTATSDKAKEVWYGSNYDRDYAAFGPAQVTNQEISTMYGDRIPNPEYPKKESENRGYGLRCYIPIKHLPKEAEMALAESCTFCFTNDQIADIQNFDKLYKKESPHNPIDIDWAVIYMKRRIKLVTDLCLSKGCSSTDIYIAAALAQNGPGFTVFSLNNWLLVKKNRINQDGITLDWYTWFQQPDNSEDTSDQLTRFKSATDGLKTWYIPRDVRFDTVRKLMKIGN